MARTWFIAPDRQLIDWSTAVTGGIARVSIYQLIDTPGTDNDVRTLWARIGSAVSGRRVAEARAQASTDPLPGAYQPPAGPPPATGGGGGGGGTTVAATNALVASYVSGSGATRTALEGKFATTTALGAKANSAALSPAAYSGAYTDLTGKPSIPTTSEITAAANAAAAGKYVKPTAGIPSADLAQSVRDQLAAGGGSGPLVDGGITSPKLADKAVTRAKLGDAAVDTPQLSSAVQGTLGAVAGKANTADLKTVATTGAYADLTGQPSIPAAGLVSIAGLTGANGVITVAALKAALGITDTAPAPADTTAPTTPGTPVATAGPNSASATTSGSTDNSGAPPTYRWYRGSALVAGANAKTVSVTGLPAGTPTSFTVEAIDASGNLSARSAASNTVTPTAPADTVAPSVPVVNPPTVGDGAVTLTWAASTDNVAVTGYEVRRGGTLIASPTGTTYTDTGLTPGTAYSYTVRAMDAAGNSSASSSSVTATPTGSTPATGSGYGATYTATYGG